MRMNSPRDAKSTIPEFDTDVSDLLSPPRAKLRYVQIPFDLEALEEEENSLCDRS
jgi:hypothetical protein